MEWDKNYLIVALSPYFLERGPVWFKENFDNIYNAAKTQNFWHNNVLFLEEGLQIKQSSLLLKLNDFNYQKVDYVKFPGEFSHRGFIIDIFSPSQEKPIRIEFSGNYIIKISFFSVQEQESIFEKQKNKLLKNLPELAGLEIGDFVVHVDHGIGIFRGYQEVPVESKNLECQKYFIIEYAPPAPHKEPDKLFVPYDKANKLSKYYGFENPTIHRLSTQTWFNTKKKVKEDVLAFAQNLLNLYSKKEISKTEPLWGDAELEGILNSTFDFELTPDQVKAIQDIYKDLESGKLMDRLILGDVGFGKTEVAIRAAFRVVLHKKQVVLLAPTTILVKQHEEVFKNRLERFGLSIVSMSRLNSKEQDKKNLSMIKSDKADIIIGTHRLLSSDIKFSNIGMLIIDEEQRFGVKQKEKIRALNDKVHVLSLSATPIPRTLNIALSGFKKMSVIETPPINRLPVQTYILPYKKPIVIETIQKEIERRGQVFYIHNRIVNIEQSVLDLKRELPKIKIDFLHGRMSEKNIVKVMEKFKNQEIDVLVSTTIIENGLDLSNVNTLIVEDATRLGLGEAYQLRGRIGRGELDSFAYFFYPKRLTNKAQMRLQALKEANYLGAGYQIALRDLEIRGAGNILGRAQSGNINKVGYNLYCQMLNQAMHNNL